MRYLGSMPGLQSVTPAEIDPGDPRQDSLSAGSESARAAELVGTLMNKPARVGAGLVIAGTDTQYCSCSSPRDVSNLPFQSRYSVGNNDNSSKRADSDLGGIGERTGAGGDGRSANGSLAGPESAWVEIGECWRVAAALLESAHLDR